MFSLPGGNVGIGTTNPQYKLAVERSIGARDIIVTNTSWSDYVFRPGYRLRPLSEVARFIRQHGHLPEIPSEAEVKEKNVCVGYMQANLLAKVEELTLHMIQQEKENRDLGSVRVNWRSRFILTSVNATALEVREPDGHLCSAFRRGAISAHGS